MLGKSDKSQSLFLEKTRKPKLNIFLIFSKKVGFDIWIFFLIFSKKVGFDISCKLSLDETICMNCESLFFREN